jgi:uncharacterized protein
VSDISEAHPFQEWVDAARPRAQLWRTLAGAVIAVVIWFVWTLVLMLIAVGLGLIRSETLQAVFGATETPMTYIDTLVVLLVALATIWGFAFGVWAAVKLVHKRQLNTVVAWNRRFSLSQFGLGCLIAAGYLAVSLGLSVLSGNAPERSDLEIGTWLMALGPIAVVVFTQAASEELMFRGYLPQQLAAHFGHPLVWGLIPSVLFGFMHAANAPGSATYTIYYIAIATVMGLVMMATVWRTGSLAAAMGFHFVNNIGALTVSGADSGPASLALFVSTPDELMRGASVELLLVGMLLAFVLSPWAPLPKGQALGRKNDTRAAP